MKVSSAFGLVALAATTTAAPVVVNYYDKVNWAGCDETLTSFESLLEPCGSEAVRCPIMAGENDGTVVFACGMTVTLQATEGDYKSSSSILGVVLGKGDANIGAGKFALGANTMKALCPFPCADESGSQTTCVAKPTECTTTGGITLPQVGTLDSKEVPLSPLTLITAGVAINYKFDDTTGPAPTDPEPVPFEAAKLPVLVNPYEIRQGAKTDCGAMDMLYTEKEAILTGAAGCGTTDDPCPISQDFSDFGDVCFNPWSNKKCIEVTFWHDGLTDTGNKYCNVSPCPQSGEIKKFFKLTAKEVNLPPKREVRIPFGVYKDICPTTCTDKADAATALFSRTCAASGGCKATIPDRAAQAPIDVQNPEWATYEIPDAIGDVYYVTHAEPVDCTMDTPEPTTTTTPSTTTPASTTPANVTTTPKPNGAAGRQAAVGGVTVLLLACSLLYNM